MPKLERCKRTLAVVLAVVTAVAALAVGLSFLYTDNILWLAVLLSALLIVEIALVSYYTVKSKTRTTTAMVVPVFGALIVFDEMTARIIILGVLFAVGAVAVACLIISRSKKKRKTVSKAEVASQNDDGEVNVAGETVTPTISDATPADNTKEPSDDDFVSAEPLESENAAKEKKVVAASDIKVNTTYDYSFRAKLMLSSEEIQSRHALISDTLQSYGVKCRESWKKERYFAKNKTYANMAFRGKTLCLYLAIEPEALEGTKYFYDNVSAVKKYEDIPVMVKIRSQRACKYATELIKMMFETYGIQQNRAVIDKFTCKTATIEELIDMGFIKPLANKKSAKAEATEDNTMSHKPKDTAPIQKAVTVEQAEAVPDEQVKPLIVNEERDGGKTAGKRKGIINIDTISEAFNDGDTVTLETLIEKKLLPKNTNLVKILARGTLDKTLTVKANDFSMDAAKMIIITGGTVVKVKTKN